MHKREVRDLIELPLPAGLGSGLIVQDSFGISLAIKDTRAPQEAFPCLLYQDEVRTLSPDFFATAAGDEHQVVTDNLDVAGAQRENSLRSSP